MWVLFVMVGSLMIVGQAVLPVGVAKGQASCLSYDRRVLCFTPGLQESVWLLAHCPSERWIRSVDFSPHVWAEAHTPYSLPDKSDSLPRRFRLTFLRISSPQRTYPKIHPTWPRQLPFLVPDNRLLTADYSPCSERWRNLTQIIS